MRRIIIIGLVLGVLICHPRTIVIEFPKVEAKTDIDIIRDVALQVGIEPHDLLGVALRESSLGKNTVGDHGCSKGWFQQNTCANPETKDNIGNIKKEAEWTANKLKEYGYPEYRTLAFARYNSPNRPNFEYAELVKKDVEWVKNNLSTDQ